ncbi:MAG: radical SAM protein [Bacteroidales bacterium]|nr:radical SAM protein [Bacteroidales bacterium]MBN2757339.1 radical SAM protein [Bacteroidales bacterium]
MGTFLFDKIIFGPVKSRRLGISLGINLLPTDSKLCNFNCIYCECGWTPGKQEIKIKFHPRELVAEKLEEMLVKMKENNEQLDVITYAGNGEPTLHTDFDKIIDDTIRLRDKYFPNVRIAVLSNATLIHKESVFKALNLVEDNILKLDSAFDETVRLLNNPIGKYDTKKLVENLKKFNGNLIIQTMFVKGFYEGKLVDNTTENELVAWIDLLHQIKPKMVMIYTIARDTPSPDLVKVSLDDLNIIKKRLENEGFEVQVSA